MKKISLTRKHTLDTPPINTNAVTRDLVGMNGGVTVISCGQIVIFINLISRTLELGRTFN